ncbi:carboxylesteras-like protein [Periconia macrospinosa]|uniref:Carboxylesteras-like protein n=1 Tax=Periconia macrospinosa TaxID=97972 RepID=A0A2V1E9V2_9PLEO|nr:carboxylesteras-like protein [Periconia macrospinosa]
MKVLKTQLGDIKGNVGDQVVQYLGLKYAHLKDQLSAPELVDSNYSTDVVDATEYGPRAPAADMCTFEQGVLIQQEISSVPTPQTPPMSGTECLNLNVTVPVLETGTKKDRKLPVMVFIHGGGLIMGSSHWLQYDPKRLVRESVKMGKPAIVVNFNYRLGLLGNLTSSELRDKGYPGNNSLRDQRCAFQWVRRYIGDFGGDADHVTAFGESAGAACVLHHLSAKEPLFGRAISMSGTPLMLKPLPKSATEPAYETIIKAFGLEDLSAEERVKRLVSITPEDLIAKTPMEARLLPFIDGDIIPSAITFKDLTTNAQQLQEKVPGYLWCKELMIGDCQHDGTVCYFMGLANRKQNIGSSFHVSLTTNLSPDSATAILAAYNITPATPDDAALTSILSLANDLLYYIPAKRFACSFPGKTYYYNFDVLNPWEGAFKGCATHLLDAAFLFGNYEEWLGEGERSVVVEMMRGFLGFANGEVLWGNEGVKRFVVDGGREGDVDEAGGSRRDILCRFEEDGVLDLDELRGAWDLFMAGM